ncbi:MAG: DUF5615 family PIN-like protein, partial [Pseudonocardiaceae bacterium]
MRFLIDEMFPQRTCAQLVERGHDAVHVRDLGLDARPDREVAAAAAREDRALVTENVMDLAAEHDIVVVCVLKSHLPQQGVEVTWPRCWISGRPPTRSPIWACTGRRPS